MNVLHAQIGQAMVTYYALVGVWGLVLALRRLPVDGAYRGALVIGVGLAVVQVLVGLALLLVLGRPMRDDVHVLYGLSAVVALPLAHLYLAGKRLPAPLAYALACLFMAGLALRGITTGR